MHQALSLVSSLHSGRFPLRVQLVQRLVLHSGELYSIPACYRLLRISAGMAYVTQAGRDLILRKGQAMGLDSVADAALVSGIGREAVIFELFEMHHEPK